jgi:hypothetical protein
VYRRRSVAIVRGRFQPAVRRLDDQRRRRVAARAVDRRRDFPADRVADVHLLHDLPGLQHEIAGIERRTDHRRQRGPEGEDHGAFLAARGQIVAPLPFIRQTHRALFLGIERGLFTREPRERGRCRPGGDKRRRSMARGRRIDRWNLRLGQRQRGHADDQV